LSADGVYLRLPEMNARKDVGAITRALAGILPFGGVSAFSEEECLAAMRDLGGFLGSLKRHAVQPVDAVPGLEEVLVELGRRTRMVPRDTVHHYTEFNPSGPRRRMYTGDPQEDCLIGVTQVALTQLSGAVEVCRRLSVSDPGQAEFPVLLTELAEKIGSFDVAMRDVARKIDPSFFGKELRPYFEDIRVGGATYAGPAGSQVPLFLVDLVVWASDHGSEQFDEFRRDAAPYALPHLRLHLPAWERAPSAVTKVSRALAGYRSIGTAPTALRDSAVALAATLRTLVLFRGKHLTYARRAYNGAADLYEAGSGGGTVDLLREILDLTRHNIDLFAGSLSERVNPRKQRHPLGASG
jgi:hypothetical protein